MICRKCNAQLSDGVAYCSACGASQTEPQQKPQTKLTTGQFVFFVIVCILAFCGIRSSLSSNNGNKSASPTTSSALSETEAANARNKELTAAYDAKQHLEEYTKFVRQHDKRGEIFTKIEQGLKPDCVQLTVANRWHSEPYQMRLQTAQAMWKAWAGFHSPKEPDKARIRIVDMVGNEVGGSRAWPASSIWVQER